MPLVMLLGLQRIACDSSHDACNALERQDYLNEHLFLSEEIPAKSFWAWGEVGDKKSNSLGEQRPLCLLPFTEGKNFLKAQKTHPYSFYLKKIYSAVTRTAHLRYRQSELAGSVQSITHDLFSFVNFWHPGAPRPAEEGAGRAQLTPRQLVSKRNSCQRFWKRQSQETAPPWKAAIPSNSRCADKGQGGSDEGVLLRAGNPDGNEACCEGAAQGCS